MPNGFDYTYFWNSGNFYTEHGHRFTAQVVKKGVIFKDHDRGIEGFIQHANTATFLSGGPTHVTGFIMANYDYNNYSMWDPEYRPLIDALKLDPQDPTHGGKAGKRSHPYSRLTADIA